MDVKDSHVHTGQDVFHLTFHGLLAAAFARDLVRLDNPRGTSTAPLVFRVVHLYPLILSTEESNVQHDTTPTKYNRTRHARVRQRTSITQAQHTKSTTSALP